MLTFDPHPRLVLGYDVQLLTTFERRLELLQEAGPDEILVVEFTQELSRREPEEFVADYLSAIGAQVVVAGEDFRFGAGRRGDVDLLRRCGLDVRAVPLLEGVSSSRIRELVTGGDLRGAADLLGRPFEVEGVVVAGDQRGGTLGFPTANLAPEPHMLVPAFGIYVGEALGTRAAVSIGVNPHYGGSERRIEAFLLDFEGDLYGERVRLELWEKLGTSAPSRARKISWRRSPTTSRPPGPPRAPAHDIRCKFSALARLSLYMGAAALSVRCLGCGSVYRAPVGEGTGTLSEGCPRCGYVGWIPIEQTFTGASEPPRSSSDQPPHPPEPPR